MSLIIENMEMPKSCDICPFVCTNDDLMSEDYRYLYCGFPYMGMFVTDYIASRHKDCPLKEQDVIPIPHGGIGEVSDGFHTFNGLYYQRMILFAALVKTYKDKAWKSYKHEDGELCFGGGWFIVGIDTPEGSYTYHYENKYFDMFDCVELLVGKHWDGHTEEDVTRLLSLQSGNQFVHAKWNKISNRELDNDYECSACLGILLDVPNDSEHDLNSFCPMCGAKMT